MRWLAWLTTGITNAFRRVRLERDARDEVAFHLERRAHDLERRGIARDEARRLARVEFGGVENYLERTREVWGFRMLGELRQDLRHAVRMFTASPGFTAIALLSIAIGIGANASIFSLADALLFRPLGVRDPDAVVAVEIARPGETASQVSYPNYRDLRERARAFDGLVAYQLTTFSFASARDVVPDMRMGMAVSDNFFSVLGIPPALGRTFSPDEGRVADRDAVLVLGHDFWQGALGGDRSIVGRDVWVNGVALKIIGVTPERFTGMDQYIRPAFFVPAMMAHRLSRTGENLVDDRTARAFDMRGRLKPRVSLAGGQTEAAVVWTGLVSQYPGTNRNLAIALRTDFDTRVRQSPEDAMLTVMLLALVALVLAIACANVANLLLGRARARSREMAIRLALGVSRFRLLRQLLTESALLAVAGCGLGIALVYAAIRSLLNIQIPTDLPVVILPQLDRRVVMFSLAAAGISALLFGVAPAWRSLRTDLVPALKGSERGGTARHRTIGRNVLVVVQVALSMVLLVATGIVLQGFRKSVVMNPGFRTDHLLMMTLDTSLAGDTAPQTHAFYRTLVDRVKTLPGIVSVAMTGAVPLDPSGEGETVIPEGYQFPTGQEGAPVMSATVDEQYFATMRAEIVRGRAFRAEDRDTTRPVVIVNEEFAKRYWPGQDPIGRRLRVQNNGAPWMDIVGIAKTGKYLYIGEMPRPFVYLPFSQHERSRMSLIVESASADPSTLVGPLRGVVRDLDSRLPIYNVRTLSTFYQQRALAIPRRLFQTVATLGVFGLILALIGLYGLVAYSVACRTKEIGIRMAIGAARSDVLRMVMRQGFTLSMTGIAFGVVGSVAAGRLLTAALAGLGEPSRPAYFIVPVLLIVLTMAASYVPARRASSIDPLLAVRHE